MNNSNWRSTFIHLLTIAALLSTCCLLLAGCNTMKGVGKDVQGAGEAIEDAAD